MYNPIRRNQNIGTAKQGHGQNNKLTIATPYGDLMSFFERLENYKKEKRIINDHEFIFITEQTRENSTHSCSINDIEQIIRQIPNKDYGDLKFIVLRQPKRKEEIISSVWGRLIYSYEFEGEYYPAIILDAIDLTRKLRWVKKQSIDNQKEFERLKEDGHEFEEDKRAFVAKLNSENARNTQLYRTLPHEFGHYVHFLELVKRQEKENEAYSEKEKRENYYFKLPGNQKEQFAHNYADSLHAKLIEGKIIPFERL